MSVDLRAYRSVAVCFGGYVLLGWLAWLCRTDPAQVAALGMWVATIAGAQAARSGAGAVAEARAQGRVGSALTDLPRTP